MDKVFYVIVFMLILVVIALIVFLIVLFSKISEMKRKQTILENKLKGENAEELLLKVLTQNDEIVKEMRSNKEAVRALEEKQKYNFDRVGVVRYNASKDAGAKMSYSVGFSNESGDGLIITGLHYNDGVNIYVKRISDGTPDVPLSKEEVAALKRSKLD
jgi:hypothetical protein